MNIADHLRLRQAEEVAVVFEILGRVQEPLSADIRLRHPVGANRRAHRPIDDGDAVLECLLKRMLVRCCHFFLRAARRKGNTANIFRIYAWEVNREEQSLYA